MKLDFDKIKALLEKSVERHQAHGTLVNGDFPEAEQEEVAFMVMHLQHRGYVEADYIPNLKLDIPAAFTIKGLTFEGHSLLKLMQDDAMWQKVKKLISDNGMELGFDNIQDALSAVIAGMITEKIH